MPGRPKRRRPCRPLDRAAGRVDALRLDPTLADIFDTSFVALDRFGRILGIATAIAEMLGYRPSQLIGRRLRHRIRVAGRAAFERALCRARAFSLSAGDGRYEPVRVSLLHQVHGTDGGEILVLKMVRDRSSEAGTG